MQAHLRDTAGDYHNKASHMNFLFVCFPVHIKAMFSKETHGLGELTCGCLGGGGGRGMDWESGLIDAKLGVPVVAQRK